MGANKGATSFTLSLSQIATILSAVVVVLGFSWSASSWQTNMNDYMLEAKKREELLVGVVNDHTATISDFKLRLQTIEDTQNRNMAREYFLRWILELQASNPEITLPAPPQNK